MAKSKAVSKSDLQSLVQAEIAAALGEGSAGSTLANERSKALDYYLARPFGNEQEGRSSVVSTDVRDTVEWIMPSLIRMFTAGEETVEFDPVTPEEEQFAKDATVYGNVVWNQDNPGFLNYYTWFKDGLISKNGLVKIWWDDSPKQKRERYDGLPDDAYTQLVNMDDVTVSEHTENKQKAIVLDPETQQPTEQEVITHDVVITREVPGGRICVEPVPPEEFLISSDGRRINSWGRPGEARMVGHRTRTTLSDLREDPSLDAEALDKIERTLGGTDDDARSTTQEELARDTVEDATTQAGVNNPAMTVIARYELYIKADVDGDGIAEMRKVTCAGPGYTVLADESWDGPRPFASVTPIIMPHRFWGLSEADLICDLQLIRSTILRQYLDNMYLSNNQRLEVVEKDIIDPTEVLTSRPGGVVRVKNAGAVNPIVVPQIGKDALAGLEYIDRLRENRTGVSERTQGTSANALHDTLGGEQMLMSAAMGKIELIGRVYAEGVREAFKIVLWNICRYQKTPRQVQLQKKWVTIDPRGWNEEMGVSISVGLGTGDNQQRLQNAMLLGQAQQAAMGAGMVTPDNLMNTATELTKAMGYKNPERFFSKPDPNKPPPPSPEMAKVQAETQAKQAQLQQDGQMKTQQLQADGQIKSAQMQQEGQIEVQKMQQEFALKRWQTEQELLLKREQLTAELQLRREQFQQELAMKERLGMVSAANEAAANTSNVHMGGEPG